MNTHHLRPAAASGLVSASLLNLRSQFCSAGLCLGLRFQVGEAVTLNELQSPLDEDGECGPACQQQQHVSCFWRKPKILHAEIDDASRVAEHEGIYRYRNQWRSKTEQNMNTKWKLGFYSGLFLWGSLKELSRISRSNPCTISPKKDPHNPLTIPADPCGAEAPLHSETFVTIFFDRLFYPKQALPRRP